MDFGLFVLVCFYVNSFLDLGLELLLLWVCVRICLLVLGYLSICCLVCLAIWLGCAVAVDTCVLVDDAGFLVLCVCCFLVG